MMACMFYPYFKKAKLDLSAHELEQHNDVAVVNERLALAMASVEFGDGGDRAPSNEH